MIFESFCEEDTESIGEKIALMAVAGSIYGVVGGLGAGKTAFARGFAKGLGVRTNISSPTFGIVNEYTAAAISSKSSVFSGQVANNISFYHFDVYRIVDVFEMENTGYEEYFFSDGITLVEWADIISKIMPKNTIYVHIIKDMENLEYRKIEVANDIIN